MTNSFADSRASAFRGMVRTPPLFFLFCRRISPAIRSTRFNWSSSVSKARRAERSAESVALKPRRRRNARPARRKRPPPPLPRARRGGKKRVKDGTSVWLILSGPMQNFARPSSCWKANRELNFGKHRRSGFTDTSPRTEGRPCSGAQTRHKLASFVHQPPLFLKCYFDFVVSSPSESPTAMGVAQLRAQGLSIRAIAAKLESAPARNIKGATGRGNASH